MQPAVDNFILIKTELVEHVPAINQDIGKLFLYVLDVVGIIAPLEALEELAGLDGDRFGEVRGRVELIPVALFGKTADALDGFRFHECAFLYRAGVPVNLYTPCRCSLRI